MAIQGRFTTSQRQASEVALILSLLVGATALLVTFGGLLTLSLFNHAEPYLSGKNRVKTEPVKASTAPTLETRIDGNQSKIVEVDAAGAVVRVIHTSEIKDHVASFTLFAVPQLSYEGMAYIQSTQDANSGTLIVYPLDVATGKLSQAVLNVPSSRATVSPDQSRVAVISLTPTRSITTFDIKTGASLGNWPLASNERISSTDVDWLNNNCFDHEITGSNGTEMRTFCLAP